MTVTLAKSTDYAPVAEFAFLHTSVWKDTVKLYLALSRQHGGNLGDSLYEGLADNDLTVLRDVFPHVTYPTLVKGQSHVVDYSPFGDPVAYTTFDYSDGYGGTYAKGE